MLRVFTDFDGFNQFLMVYDIKTKLSLAHFTILAFILNFSTTMSINAEHMAPLIKLLVPYLNFSFAFLPLTKFNFEEPFFICKKMKPFIYIFQGASSFKEEMCIVFLNYYPKKTEINRCLGQGDEQVVQFIYNKT